MRLTTVIVVLVSAIWARNALGATRATAPGGGGLPPLEVRVDLAHAMIDAAGVQVPIGLSPDQMPSEGEVVVDPIDIGQGRHVVHVRIPAKADVAGIAWEAILAAGKPAPIFAGVTGPVRGDPGERAGKAVRIVPNGATSFVLVGDEREDLRICGQDRTLLAPLAVYPASLDLRPATVQRLSAKAQETAERVIAAPSRSDDGAPLGKLLVARGSSVPGSSGSELTDGDTRTAWVEDRPGVGQGEFVVMAAPKEVPITRIGVVLASQGAEAPKTFYLVTSAQTFEVTLAGDDPKPGTTYDVAFPQPVETSCVALVLGSAIAHRPHPAVGVAELVAYSEFDAPGATLDDVAKNLSGERGVAAAQVLARSGRGALAAVEKAFDGLDERGQALAIDVASAHERCDEAAPLLARGLCAPAREVNRRARETIGRCKEAAPVLATALRADAKTRACVAPVLAAIAPLAALEPIADAMGDTPEADGVTRAALRGAFAGALESAPAAALAAIVGDSRRTAAARLEILRAADGRVVDARPESERALADLTSPSAPMRTRYLAFAPLEALARAGDGAAAATIADAIARDPDWPVRARAAEAGVGIASAVGALLSAARDREPRVREVALRSLGLSAQPSAVDPAVRALGEDPWPFVRAQAVGVLAAAPAGERVDGALGAALADGSAAVRTAAIGALAHHRAASGRDRIRERMGDKDEDSEVRAAAARALGAICDAGSTDRLTELARGLALPDGSDDAQRVGLGALVGLAALKPADLRGRLAPLLSADVPPGVRAAALSAVSAPSACH
jgi:HEAT repeats